MSDIATPDRLLIFVPMYNCAAQIGRVIAQFASLSESRFDFSVLCVDNRSSDDTLEKAELALAASPIAKKFLVRNNDNYGLGGSHKVAFEFARLHDIEYVVVLHGDDQGLISDLIPHLESGAHRRVDALLGARFMKGSKLQGYSLLRTLANEVFNLLFSAIARRRIYDLGSGLNLFRRSIFDTDFHVRYADDLTFNYYLIFGLLDHGREVGYFPIHWREDDQVSNAKLFSQGLAMLRLLRGRLLDRRAFHDAEHRRQPRLGYPCTLVRRWGPATGAGASVDAAAK
jgi:glycosyltransferase involved in cell wall biosynthesis